MKYFLMLAMLSLFSFRAISQADKVITGTKITKQQTPDEVIKALEAKFPNAKSVEYYKIPPDSAKNGWTISEEDKMPESDAVDYYTISFKNSDMKYYALYDPHGKLLKSKLQDNVDHLPTPVHNAVMGLGTKYPGYKVVSKTYYRDINYSDKKEVYEVVASNGTSSKTFYFKPDGTLTKTK